MWCFTCSVIRFLGSKEFHACLVLDPIEISNDATIKTSHNWNLSRYRVIREKSQNWWLEPSEEPSSPFLSHLLFLFFIDLHHFFIFPLIFGHSNLFLHFTYVASVWVEMMSKGVGRFHALIIAMLISRLTLGVTAPLLGILSKWLIVGRYKVVRWKIDFLSYFTNPSVPSRFFSRVNIENFLLGNALHIFFSFLHYQQPIPTLPLT